MLLQVQNNIIVIKFYREENNTNKMENERTIKKIMLSIDMHLFVHPLFPSTPFQSKYRYTSATNTKSTMSYCTVAVPTL